MSFRSSVITRTIWMLSLVSLFTDMASEMLYPVMPSFLRSIGFSVLLIGILEGLATAVAGLSNNYFGRWSDALQRRLPFVQLGYTLSAISKPIMAVFTNAWWIFSARTLDRIGKGLRTAARDAMLSAESKPENRGTVFGFHRAMDTMGAVLGPVFALLFLYLYPGQYAWLFYIAFFPGLVAVIITLLLKEKTNAAEKKKRITLMESFLYWRESTVAYRQLVAALLIFALANSSDIFLLLKIKEAGFNDTWVIGVYIFYNLVYALFAFPFGRLADKWGLKKVFIAGLILFILTYSGFAFNKHYIIFWFLFLSYGLYAACTEGVAKAWISNLCKKEETASAIGTYAGFQSIVALLSSSVAGWIWLQFGAPATFLFSAMISLLVVVYLLSIRR